MDAHFDLRVALFFRGLGDISSTLCSSSDELSAYTGTVVFLVRLDFVPFHTQICIMSIHTNDPQKSEGQTDEVVSDGWKGMYLDAPRRFLNFDSGAEI